MALETGGKRIKWMETKTKGIWISDSLLYSAKYNKHYNLIMNENNFTFKIFDTLQGKTVYSFPEGILTSKQNLRRHIRKKVRELGVELGMEMRDFRGKK